jgi:hypothetical protein
LDVATIFGDLRLECLHQRVVRNTIFRKAPPSVVSGYGKRSIHLNKVVATFDKHIFLSQTDLTRTGIISNSYNEMFEAKIVSFYVSTETFFLLHCDEWDRVVALPRHKFITGATLLQLNISNAKKKKKILVTFTQPFSQCYR